MTRGRKGRELKPCVNSGCDRMFGTPGSAHGLCSRCYQRARLTESLTTKYAPKGTGHVNKVSGYREAYDPNTGKKTYEHILIAEKALGKPLPPKAVVHHVTENRHDNHGPFKLVICPDQSYHFLIHRLMREKGISFKEGWPND